MFDIKGNLLGYKDSPIDRGIEIFWYLYENRITLQLTFMKNYYIINMNKLKKKRYNKYGKI